MSSPASPASPLGLAAVGVIEPLEFGVPYDWLYDGEAVQSPPILVAGYNCFHWQILAEGNADEVYAFVLTVDPMTGQQVTSADLVSRSMSWAGPWTIDLGLGAFAGLYGLIPAGADYVWHTIALGCEVVQGIIRVRFRLWAGRR